MKRLIVFFLALLCAAFPLSAQSSSSGSSDSSQSESGSASQLDPSLYAVGSLGASNLYFSYVVLGTVADGYASRGYGADMARNLAQEAIALNRESRSALQTLIDEGRVADEDRDVVSRMIEAHGLLIQQAQGLLSYIDDRSQTEAFQRHREQAWQHISSVLGIPEGGRAPDAGGGNGAGSSGSGAGSSEESGNSGEAGRSSGGSGSSDGGTSSGGSSGS